MARIWRVDTDGYGASSPPGDLTSQPVISNAFHLAPLCPDRSRRRLLEESGIMRENRGSRIAPKCRGRRPGRQFASSRAAQEWLAGFAYRIRCISMPGNGFTVACLHGILNIDC